MRQVAWVHWPVIGMRYTVEPNGVHTVDATESHTGSLMALLARLLSDGPDGGWHIVAVLRIDDCGGREVWLERERP